QRYRPRHLAALVPFGAFAILAIAEPHAGVGVNRGSAELAATRLAARFIALEDARVALQRFTECAGARLCVACSLAADATAHPLTQHRERPQRPRRVRTCDVGMHDAVARRSTARQTGHDAADRADVMLKALHPRLRRARAVASVRRERLAPARQRDRLHRGRDDLGWIATGVTLRPRAHPGRPRSR